MHACKDKLNPREFRKTPTRNRDDKAKNLKTDFSFELVKRTDQCVDCQYNVGDWWYA